MISGTIPRVVLRVWKCKKIVHKKISLDYYFSQKIKPLGIQLKWMRWKKLIINQVWN